MSYVFTDWTDTQLKDMYESICEEYRRRLCEQWEIPFGESWWSQDHIGENLFLADWWMPLDMEELRYCVDNGVTEKAWLEYCAFMESEIHGGHDRPRINFHSWFALGCRPKDLNNGEADTVG